MKQVRNQIDPYQLSLPIFSGDLEQITDCNPAFNELFQSQESIFSSDFALSEIFENRADYDRFRTELTLHKRLSNYRCKFKSNSGSVFYGNISAQIISESAGEMEIQAYLQNIDDQVAYENTLLDKYQLFESINQNLDETVIRSNSEGIIYSNEAGLKLFGFKSLEEMKSHGMEGFYKDGAERSKLLSALNTSGEVQNIELQLKKMDESVFWSSFTTKKKLGSNDEILYDTTIRDISEMKAREQKIKILSSYRELIMKISMKYLNFSLENVNQEIIRSLEEICALAGAQRALILEKSLESPEYKITAEWSQNTLNKSAHFIKTLDFDNISAMLGNSEDDTLVIHKVSEIADNSIKQELTNRGIKSLIYLTFSPTDNQMTSLGLEYYEEEVTITPEISKLLALFAQILVSVKSRTVQEQSLKELLRTTTSQNEILREFSFITSHNMRSSVSNLMLLVDFVEQHPDKQLIISMLRSSCDKLNETINGLNDMINLEGQLSNLNLFPCDINDIIRHCIVLNQNRISELDATLNLSLESQKMARGYRPLLESVFNNMLTNAMKYGITDTSKKIKISTRDTEGRIEIVFQDFGLGMNLEKFGHKLFKMGSRLHTKLKDGQGIGLYMCKRHIELMDGAIEVESQEKNGTKFKIYLNESR